MTISLIGMEKAKITKKEFAKYLGQFKNVKSYNEFSDLELIVYTSGYNWIGAKDINTNDFWIRTDKIKIN
jgi:hypothetical protein